jgi:hypothetical protein
MAFGSEVMPNIALQRTPPSVTPLNAAFFLLSVILTIAIFLRSDDLHLKQHTAHCQRNPRGTKPPRLVKLPV